MPQTASEPGYTQGWRLGCLPGAAAGAVLGAAPAALRLVRLLLRLPCGEPQRLHSGCGYVRQTSLHRPLRLQPVIVNVYPARARGGEQGWEG